MRNWTKYQRQRKKRAIGMLEKLAERIENGQLVVEDFGFWPSRFDNRITFRVIVISRDDEEESKEFVQFS
jgi:hypothetical protein